ncbi:hypothetical protein NQ176_g10967 [Zarea fungicola]|uniref:Uncharacterized protein n=1 Tax=Zarea fungicola TaxID=93591 RepID=A0ACC1MCP6_9HYPO|nr:hypothetical protein NQ176_g10967 [Lecanicillium fungicola]
MVSRDHVLRERHVSHYEVDSASRRTRRVAADADTGHAYYMHSQPIRVSETRMPTSYREANYTGMHSAARGYANPKTSKYQDIQYSDHHYPYREAVRT